MVKMCTRAEECARCGPRNGGAEWRRMVAEWWLNVPLRCLLIRAYLISGAPVWCDKKDSGRLRQNSDVFMHGLGIPKQTTRR